MEVQLIYWSLYFGLPIIQWIVHDVWTRCHCSILVVAILSLLFNDPILGLSNPGIVIRGSGLIAKSFGDLGVLNSVSLISLHNDGVFYHYSLQYICPPSIMPLDICPPILHKSNRISRYLRQWIWHNHDLLCMHEVHGTHFTASKLHFEPKVQLVFRSTFHMCFKTAKVVAA